MAAQPAELATMRAEARDLLAGVGGLLADLLVPLVPSSPQQADEAAEAAVARGLDYYWQAHKRLRQRSEQTLMEIAVLALTKSGKSTLLNALAAADLMPVNNVPETARIIRLVHDEQARAPYLLEPGTGCRTDGEQAVRAKLSEFNCHARSRNDSWGSPLSQQPPPGQGPLLPEPGQAGRSQGAAAAPSPVLSPAPSLGHALADDAATLEVHAPIAALVAYGGGGGAASGTRLALLDTPGPNEAGEEQLRFQVERLLSGVDAVLYLLDYTKLKTAEEAQMFARLRMINPQLVQRLAQRLFFVVNKVDAAAVSEGLGPDETRAYVAALVTGQLGGTMCSFALHPEQVVLVSARNALLARLVLSGRASEEARRRFLTLAFGSVGAAAAATGGLRGHRAAFAPTQEQVEAAALCMLEDSGVMDLEHQVLSYLYTHSGPVKLLALLDDAVRLVQEVGNTTAASRACLERGVEEQRRNAQDLARQLQDTMTAFDEVLHETASVADEVAKEVGVHLQQLRGTLFTHILQALDVDAAAIEAARNPMGSSGRWEAHQQRTSGSAATVGRWRRVRERFLSIFAAPFAAHVASGGVAAAPGGPSGAASVFGQGQTRWQWQWPAHDSAGPSAVAQVPVARSRSRDEMASLVADLHDDLLAMVNLEVAEFWNVIEACANARHRELLGRVNAHLERLSGAVEAAVAERLDVRLQPVQLSMAPPSAERFHSDLTELIQKGIQRTSERHIRVAQRQCAPPPDHREGICKWGRYWTQQEPRVRTVVEAYDVTVWELQPAEIAAHFIAMVDGAVEETQRALGAHISAFVSQQLAAARGVLSDYAERYLEVTASALDVSERGAGSRQEALQQVERLSAEAARLGVALRDLRARAELGVPNIQDPIPFDDLQDDVDLLGDELPMPPAQQQLEQPPPSAAAATEHAEGAAAAVEGGEEEAAAEAAAARVVAMALEAAAAEAAAADEAVACAALGLPTAAVAEAEGLVEKAVEGKEQALQGPVEGEAQQEKEVEGAACLDAAPAEATAPTEPATAAVAAAAAAVEGEGEAREEKSEVQAQGPSTPGREGAGSGEQGEQGREEWGADAMAALLAAAQQTAADAMRLAQVATEAAGAAAVEAAAAGATAPGSTNLQGGVVGTAAAVEVVGGARAAAAAGGRSGGSSPRSLDMEAEVIEYDDVPFDYEIGFARAMSTSGMIEPASLARLSASAMRAPPASTVPAAPAPAAGPAASAVSATGGSASASGLLLQQQQLGAGKAAGAPEGVPRGASASGSGSTLEEDWIEVQGEEEQGHEAQLE